MTPRILIMTSQAPQKRDPACAVLLAREGVLGVTRTGDRLTSRGYTGGRNGSIPRPGFGGSREQVMPALMEARRQIGDLPTEVNVPAPEASISVIRTVVDCLAAGDYEGALEAAPTTRMSAQNLADSIKDYGARLVPIPEHGLRQLEMTRVETAKIPTWHVSVPIWTAEEGRSDLTLELWVKHLWHGLYGAEMLNLHVL